MAMLKRKKTSPKTEETNLARAEGSFAWFDDFRRTFEDRFFGPLERWGESGETGWQPLVDLIDQGSEFVVRAEIPGVPKEDVDLKVTERGIEIRAETNRSREAKEKTYYYQERTYLGVQRNLAFPAAVKANLVSATLKDGVLEVRVPKREPTPDPRAVKVQVE